MREIKFQFSTNKEFNELLIQLVGVIEMTQRLTNIEK